MKSRFSALLGRLPVSWLRRGGVALIDQGIFSAANFLIHIALGRWLRPDEYGAFAVAFSAFLFFASFHTALLSEPMQVFGSGKYSGSWPAYLGTVLKGHWGLSLLGSIVLGAVALGLRWSGSTLMAEALFALALAAPLLLLLWLVRRGCYVQLKARWALIASVINLLVSLAGVALLFQANLLSSFSSVLILGAAAGLASTVPLLLLAPRLIRASGAPSTGEVLHEHWGYGSWNLVGVVLYWLSGQGIMFLIPVFLGLAASATVAAVWNLYRPVSLLIQTSGLLLLPAFSRLVNQQQGTARLRRQALRFAAVFVGGIALYVLTASVFAEPILDLLYAGKYSDQKLLVAVLGTSIAASAAIQILTLALKAQERVREVSFIWAVSAAFTLLAAIPAMLVGGLTGAMLVLALSYLVASVIAFAKLRSPQGYGHPA